MITSNWISNVNRDDMHDEKETDANESKNQNSNLQFFLQNY